MGRILQRYKRFFDQLKPDAPQRVYFLYGPEEFLKKEFISELIKVRLAEQNRAFNLDIFHGDDFVRDAFNDRISSFPLFTERRMIILKRFEALPTAHQDFVLDRIETLPESIVFVAETPRDRVDTARLKRLKTLADDRGISFRFEYLSDDETIERVKNRLRREGFGIEPEALELLVESVGTHLSDVANEVEKIMLSADPGAVIDKETVAAVVGKYRTENLFAFLDKLGKRDVADVVRKLHQVIDGGEEPVFILAMLLRRVIQLLHVRLLLDEAGVSARTIGPRMAGRVSPYQVTMLVDQSRRFELDELEAYLTNLRWADVKLKSTGIPPRNLLETALVASAQRITLALSDD